MEHILIRDVVALQGNPVNAVGPSTGQVLGWDGYAWTPVAAPNSTPTGSAGGDLSGTYPNPTVAKIQGNTVSAIAATAGQFLIENNTATGSAWTSISGDISADTSTVGNLTVNTISGSSPVIIENAGTLEWGSAVSSPILTQVSTSSGSGSNLTVQAQSATGGSNNGGSLILAAGTSGSGSAGNIQLVGTTVSAGGGAGVIGITNATVIPTTSPTNGAILYSSGGVLNVLQSNGITFPISSGTFTAGGDLTGTGAAQYVDSLSYNSTSAGGTIAINGTSTILQWANNTTPTINQAVLSAGGSATAGKAFTISSQAGQSAALSGQSSGAGGALSLTAGSGGTIVGGIGNGGSGGSISITAGTGTTAVGVGGGNGGNGGNVTISAGSAGGALGGTAGTAGNVILQAGGSTQVTISPSSITLASLAGNGAGYVAVSNTGVLSYTSTATPGGSASGDLSGTYPSPTVAKIQGNTVTSGSLTIGKFLVATSTTNWTATTISGDISSSGVTAGALTVTGIQGNTVTSGALTVGRFLIATTTSNWAQTALSGDVSESAVTPGLLTVKSISGSSPIAITPASLQFTSATTAPNLSQASTSTGSGTSLTIQAQGATGASNAGGNLVLAGGTSGSSNAGNILIGTTVTVPTGGGVIGISNASTIPSSSPTNGAILYSTGGVLNVLQSNGTTFALSPSNAFTAGGDLTGTSSSQQVVSLTGTAGVVNTATTTTTIQFSASSTLPKIKQADLAIGTSATQGQTLTITAQNGESGSTSGSNSGIGGTLSLNAGNAGNPNGGTSGAGGAVIISAGNAGTGGSVGGAGGSVTITSGSPTGSAVAGNILLQTAGTTQLTISPTSLATPLSNLNFSGGTANFQLAGTTTFSLSSTATTSTHSVFIGTNPAASGFINVPNNGVAVAVRNAANTNDIKALYVDNSNDIWIGYPTSATVPANIYLNATTAVEVYNNLFQFDTSVTSPVITQGSTVGSGQTLLIEAQNAGSTGGTLNLSSGSGSTAGAVNLQTGGTTRLAANASGVITIANLSTGLVHSDASGNLTSSSLVNGDIAVNTITVNKIVSGTAGQLLLSNNTPATAWVTMSGDVTISGTGATTVNKISGSSPIAISPQTLQWNTGTASPYLFQADNTTSSGAGQTLTVQAQNATGTTSTGGNLVLTSGTGTTTAGNVLIETGGTSAISITPSSVTISSLSGHGSGFVAVNNAGVLSYSSGATPSGSAGGDLSGTYPNPKVASLTGSSGIVSTASTTTTIQFNASSTSAIINQADNTTTNATGTQFTITAQNALTGASSVGGLLSLNGGGGLLTGGAVSINGGNGSGPSGHGGNAIVNAGGGISTNGSVLLQVSGTTEVTVSGTAITMALPTTFTATGTGLTVNNNATVSGTLNTGTINGSSGIALQNSGTTVASIATNKFITSKGTRRNLTLVNTSTYTVLASDDIIAVDASGGAIAITLPSSPTTGDMLLIKDSTGNAAANNITITAASGNIDANASVVIDVNFGSIELVYAGSLWNII